MFPGDRFPNCRHSVLLSRRGKCEGLQVIASALAGHKFPGANHAATGAWGLSPAFWMYVYCRVDRYEEGWRRNRGLSMLRRVASRRSDLAPPILQIRCSIIWPGSRAAKNVLETCFRDLISRWRSEQFFVPVVRHVRFACSFLATPNLTSLLSNHGELADFIDKDTPPVCNCQELLADGNWPSIRIGNECHIAASQDLIPWPTRIRHLRKWPSSIALPPRKRDLERSVRLALNRLRCRCKIPEGSAVLDDYVHECVARLYPHVETRASGCPVSWDDVQVARKFLRGFFVSMFDHNTSHIGVFCMRLAWTHARTALSLGESGKPSGNFEWCADVSFKSALASMSAVPGLKPTLLPKSVSVVPCRSWTIGEPKFLPKWKAPGVKWRLLVDKHSTPCNGLHGIVSRAVDVVLNAMPKHMSSDLNSIRDFVEACLVFNDKLAELVTNPVTCTVAGDMADCYHHIPCEDCIDIWRRLQTYWMNRGVLYISVPRCSKQSPGKLGRHELRGWVCVTFDDVSFVLEHFRATNFVRTRSMLGREVFGVPQGDSLSGAALRLFKWGRERVVACEESSYIARSPGSHCQLVRLNGSNVLVLDVSFRDDVRKFCAWESGSLLQHDCVLAWGRENFSMRFEVGTMKLEDSNPNVFIGLKTLWGSRCLEAFPDSSDAWLSASYDDFASACLKPWCSWGPVSQKRATVIGLCCRSWFLSTSRFGFREALFDYLVCLIKRALFPKGFVLKLVRDWSRVWSPKGPSCVKSVHIDIKPSDIDVVFPMA